MKKAGGTLANLTGNAQERFIEHRLLQEGYTFIDRKRFAAATKSLDQPIYTKQCYVGQSIYQTPLYCDFLLFHPVKHKDCLAIESKWQQSGGSVDEKYPYLVLNIKTCFPYRAILVLDGRGYKPKARDWLKSQVGGNLIAVFDMAEFQKWVNQGNL